jgi:hypothetical protein
MSEYVLEVESFKTQEEAAKFAKKHIKPVNGKTVNIVSRDITVVELGEVDV